MRYFSLLQFITARVIMAIVILAGFMTALISTAPRLLTNAAPTLLMPIAHADTPHTCYGDPGGDGTCDGSPTSNDSGCGQPDGGGDGSK